MKPWFFLLALTPLSLGCTTFYLERQTVRQTNSVSELRYREVLNNLALIAANHAALPTYSSIFAGTIQVTDTGQLASTTVWQHVIGGMVQNGFASEAASPQLTRNLTQNWSLDPIVAPEKIEAMRCARLWVLQAPSTVYAMPCRGENNQHCDVHSIQVALQCSACAGLLASPKQDHTPGRHFDVADRLSGLPTGWLHVGAFKDVPLGAAYKAHHGCIWVWVTPDGLEGLSQFTLVFEDIARVSINSESLYYQPSLPCVYTREDDATTTTKDGKITTSVQVSVAMDKFNNIVPVVPYRQIRIDNIGSDANFRSQVSAAGAP